MNLGQADCCRALGPSRPFPSLTPQRPAEDVRAAPASAAFETLGEDVLFVPSSRKDRNAITLGSCGLYIFAIAPDIWGDDDLTVLCHRRHSWIDYEPGAIGTPGGLVY